MAVSDTSREFKRHKNNFYKNVNTTERGVENEMFCILLLNQSLVLFLLYKQFSTEISYYPCS